MIPSAHRQRHAAFTTVEVIVALLLFSGATASVLVMSTAMNNHRSAATAATQENAYATFQSQVALQGINPALVGNPLQSAINLPGTTGTSVALGTNTALKVMRHSMAQFEVNAVTQPAGAQRSLAGSARVDAVNYNVAPVGTEATRGLGVGFGIELSGPASLPNAIPLAPPAFNIEGTLIPAEFPINNVATLPSSNPPGTTYHYTTDGSAPTAASLLWDNNPGWSVASFPGQVTIAAFNSDPQYASSTPVTASYSMQLVVSYGRADGRTTNIYGFSLNDLSEPADGGVALSANASPSGISVLYTLDGSDPITSGTAFAYNGPFAPNQSQFSPTVLLNVAAISTDPRFTSAPVTGYLLGAVTSPLQPPTYITSNAQPLAPGTPVVLSAGTNSTPRTEVNNGTPTAASSNATSFPLN